MGKFLQLLLVLGCLGVALRSAPPQQPAPAAPRAFVRYVEETDGGHVDVLVATYRKGDTTLALHAALHIADPEHYAAMQERFTKFDVLLYELIADAATRPHPGMAKDDGLLTMLQSGMGKGLSLVAQMNSLDYRRPNFVHADMTPEEFTAALDKAGKGAIGDLLASQKTEPDREKAAQQRRLDLVAAFRSGRGAHEVRVMGARLVTEQMTGSDGDGEPSVLIEARNERCLAVLQEQLAAGKHALGIYYGAAHMPHLERRLVQDLGLQPVGEEWVMAWDCRASRFPTEEKGLQQKRYRSKQDLEALFAAVEEWRKANVGATTAPTWALLRKARPEGKLPGRADGVDPWGREYVLRSGKAGYEVRCLGSDGVVDTADDLVVGPPESLAGNAIWGAREGLRKNVETVAAEAMLKSAEISALTLAEVAEMYARANKRMPTVADLATPDASGNKFLDRAEPDPWGHDYVIRAGDKAGKFVVLSAGPDGVLDTADDISSAPATPPAKK